MEVDSLVLGRVKSVSKFHLDVCLPHGKVGRVHIYDISDKYTELLKKLVSTGLHDNDVASVGDMFRVGQSIRGSVKSNASEAGEDAFTKSKTSIELSLNPKVVNRGVLQKDLSLKVWLVGAVVTEEDHGYTLDIGISDLDCFLPKNQVTDKIYLGQLLSVVPLAGDAIDFAASRANRILTVKCLQDIGSDYVLNPLSSFRFGSLLPGAWLKGLVHGKVGSTLVVKFGDYVISINRAHYKGREDEFVVGKEVIVCLLVVDPGTKQLTGSLLPHLLPADCRTFDSNCCTTVFIGSKFSNATIERVDKRTIHVNLDNTINTQGVIRRAHVPEKLKSENLKGKFSVGQKVTCRVIDHDLLENVAVATMNKKLLRLPYLSIHEISPGDKVNAEVHRFTKTGIVVRVEERLNGLIPFLHLADMPIKRPSEKFTRGQKLACRVLTVDNTNNKLILTAKRGLVEATCPLLGSKEMLDDCLQDRFLQVSNDRLVAAFVGKVMDQGLLMIGLNGLRAWLPKRECGLSEDDALEATFFQGQVLRVRVVRTLNRKTDPSKPSSHYLVSLKLKGTEETSQKSRKGKSSSSLTVGQIFDAKVIRVQNTGIIVELEYPADTDRGDIATRTVGTAFLRFEHLTDHETSVPLLIQCISTLKPGATLSFDGSIPRQVVIINQTGRMALVSAKPSLLNAAKKLPQADESDQSSENTTGCTGFVRDFSDLRVGSQWFAWIHNHVDYGVFVNFPGGIRGLAPVRLLSDTRIPPKVNVIDLFPPGATVIAKVVELAPSEKRRCLVSLRMIDTYVADELYADGAIQSLRTWLTEQQWISARQDALSAYRIGDLVQFRISDSDALVAVGEACKLARLNPHSSKKATWISAVVYRENADGVDCKAGQLCDGVVTFVDFAASRLELALSTWLLNSINHRNDTEKSCVLRPGQKVSSIAMAVRPRDVVVVAFRGHAAGRFGLVPPRRTFNDVVSGNAWSLGQRNQVTLRKPFEQTGSGSELYLCTLTIYDPTTTVFRSSSSRSKLETLLKETINSASHLTLAPGTQLTGLLIHRVVGQMIFFQLPSSSKRLVFCRAINWDETSKSVRSFLAHPPAPGTAIDRTATVIFAASEDTGGRGKLHSRMPEVSFLEKPQIDVGDLVCGRLLHVGRDHWTLRLPGDALGRLHVTAMYQAKRPQPISLQSPEANANAVVHRGKELGTDLNKNRLITCRVVDKVEHSEPTHSEQCTSLLYYVCTIPSVVNGGVEFAKCKDHGFGQVTDAFVKSRSPHGLLVSLTHVTDMLIPIEKVLCARLRKAKIGFRVGDHVLVRPVRMFEDKLVGELVFEDADPLPADETELHSVTVALMQHVAMKMDRAAKRMEHAKRTASTLKFYDEPQPGEKRDTPCISVESPSKSKKPRLMNSMNSEQYNSSNFSEEQQNKNSPESFEFLGADQQVVQRYTDYMLPTEYELCEKLEPEKSNEDVEASDTSEQQSKRDDPSTTEWRLREIEQRKAMLAALTTTQQCLPKGAMRPTTTEEFELAVRNAPSSAACWTAYMMHILEGTEKSSSVTEARTIAERGLRAIANAPGLEPGELELQQARLLLFYLVLEAKELERCTQEKETHTFYRLGSDPVLEMNDQANRLSQVLSRLVNLDQADYTRKAIETMVDIGQYERAEELARRLIKSNPKDVDRWLSLIRVRFRAGRVASAREAQRNAVGLVRSTQLPRLVTGAARLEFEYGDADRSLTLFREQLAAHPRQRLVYEEFIKVLLLAGKKSDAKSVNDQAKVSLKPNDYEFVNNIFETHMRKLPTV